MLPFPEKAKNEAELPPPPEVLEEKDLMNKHMLDEMRERKLARPEKAKLLDMIEKAKKRRRAMMEKTKAELLPPPGVLRRGT